MISIYKSLYLPNLRFVKPMYFPIPFQFRPSWRNTALIQGSGRWSYCQMWHCVWIHHGTRVKQTIHAVSMKLITLILDSEYYSPLLFVAVLQATRSVSYLLTGTGWQSNCWPWLNLALRCTNMDHSDEVKWRQPSPQRLLARLFSLTLGTALQRNKTPDFSESLVNIWDEVLKSGTGLRQTKSEVGAK